jgi:hypothetical protein
MHCPNCGADDTVKIRPGFTVGQLGSFALSGSQTKFPAREVAIAECTNCDLYVTGRIEGATYAEDGKTFTGGHFIVEGSHEH